MKPLLYALLSLFLISSCATTQKAWYSSESVFAPTHATFYCSAISEEGQLYVVINIKSEQLQFIESPTMKLKNFNEEVLTLQGESLSSHTSTSGVPIYGLDDSGAVVPGGSLVVSELSTMARFPVSEKDIPFFEPGIMKVRISTVPIVHEREFYQDKFGGWLYKELLKVKKQEEDF